MQDIPKLEDYPLKTYDKLRYADTDRQGHVNNAIFATFFETGRVELLYDPEDPLADPGTAFVIANLTLNFLFEVNVPGRVEIGTRVTSIGRSSFTFDQALFQSERCVARATSVIVLMNEETRKSQNLPDRIVQRLTAVSGPS